VSLHQVQSLEGMYDGMLKHLSELGGQVTDSQAEVSRAAAENAELLAAAAAAAVGV
jgi:hypothetical protein